MAEPTKKTRGPSMTTAIVIALLLGVSCGLFFGEQTTWIKWIGDAFVGLLQMAVLPYVVVSLIANVGRLSTTDGARLLRISAAVLLALWGVALVTLMIMMQAFPAWETGSFFSSSFTEEPPSPNWLELFIPSNPFKSLASNSIPAVVVFSIGLGIALMAIPNKAALLDPLDVFVAALSKLNKLVVKLTPVGMFAIVAYTAGTIDIEQFSLIQGYLLTYGAASIVLSFVIMPTLISAFTPFSFREVVSASRNPMIAAFVIGNSFVVLPMVIDAVNRLLEEKDLVREDKGRDPDILVPLAYPFPDAGRIVGLIFIPFAAWFYGNLIDLDRYAALIGVGLIGSFGKPVITIPLLLNIAELPGDIFNLFLASGVIAARFGDLMKTMHLITFTILVSCIVNRTAKIEPRKLILGAVGSLLLLFLSALGIRGYLDASFKDHYSKEKLVTEREMVFPQSRPMSDVSATILDEEQSGPNPTPILAGQTRIDRIIKRGVIRIGVDPQQMPFAYYSASNKLIGFDIEMAYYLADDLTAVANEIHNPNGTKEILKHVSIEFVLMDRQNLVQQLRDDHFDVAMSALEGTVNQAALLPSIDPYMDVTLAIVVPDHEKQKYRTRDEILKIPDLKLAVIKGSYFAERAAKVLPEIERIELDSASEYFDGRYVEANGLVTSAESGSAWTLRQPKFTVANPLKGRIRVPLYYLTAADPEFEQFLQNWLTLKRSDGTYEQLYEFWILGQDKQSKKRRWSIMHDVLGWFE